MPLSNFFDCVLLLVATFFIVSVNAGNCNIETEHLEYTRQRIREASLEPDPFPFIIINDVFHNKVYECILQNLETTRGKVSKPVRTRNRSAVRANEDFRQYYNINSEVEIAALRRVHKFKHKQLQFFRSLRLVLNSMETEFLMKFEDTLRLRKPPFDIRSDKTYDRQLLTFDWTNYEIYPHNDTPKKLVTVIVYLPENADDIKLGTSLLRKRQMNSEPTIFKERAQWDQFDFVVNATFTPNKALAFSACSSSWHGVRNIGKKLSGPRITLQFFVMNGEKEVKKIGLCS